MAGDLALLRDQGETLSGRGNTTERNSNLFRGGQLVALPRGNPKINHEEENHEGISVWTRGRENRGW